MTEFLNERLGLCCFIGALIGLAIGWLLTEVLLPLFVWYVLYA